MQTDFWRKVPLEVPAALENLLNQCSSKPRSGWVDFNVSVEVQRKAEKRQVDSLTSFKNSRDSLRVHGDFIGIGGQVLMGVK